MLREDGAALDRDRPLVHTDPTFWINATVTFKSAKTDPAHTTPLSNLVLKSSPSHMMQTTNSVQDAAKSNRANLKADLMCSTDAMRTHGNVKALTKLDAPTMIALLVQR